MGHSRTFLRKALKVLRSPRLAAALINAQVRIRGKARLPLSVRLTGRIRLRGDGDLEFGQGVTLVGDVVPIEFFICAQAPASATVMSIFKASICASGLSAAEKMARSTCVPAAWLSTGANVTHLTQRPCAMAAMQCAASWWACSIRLPITALICERPRRAPSRRVRHSRGHPMPAKALRQGSRPAIFRRCSVAFADPLWSHPGYLCRIPVHRRRDPFLTKSVSYGGGKHHGRAERRHCRLRRHAA
jgi:hypothetical protein